MLTSLLATKLNKSQSRFEEREVSRLHPLVQLDYGFGLGRKLVNISTHTGFGETTLLTASLDGFSKDSHSQSKVAGNSRDISDNDPYRFLAYTNSSAQTLQPDIGVIALTLLATPLSFPIVNVHIKLLNELIIPHEILVFVFVDYPLVKIGEIHQTLSFIIEYLPTQLLLAILARADRPLSLSQLCANDHLTELQAVKLRFALDETLTFLNPITGLNLNVKVGTALKARIEGWIAG